METSRTDVIAEEVLERRYQEINWCTPLDATLGRQRGLLCRFCIAQVGIKGTETDRLFHNMEDFKKHLKEKHNRG